MPGRNMLTSSHLEPIWPISTRAGPTGCYWLFSALRATSGSPVQRSSHVQPSRWRHRRAKARRQHGWSASIGGKPGEGWQAILRAERQASAFLKFTRELHRDPADRARRSTGFAWPVSTPRSRCQWAANALIPLEWTSRGRLRLLHRL